MHTVRTPRCSTLVPLKCKVHKGRANVSLISSNTLGMVLRNSSINTPAPYPLGRGPGIALRCVVDSLPEDPSGTEPQWSTVITYLVPHPLLDAFPSLSHFHTLLHMFLGILFQINYLHSHPYPKICFRENTNSVSWLREYRLPDKMLSIWHASTQLIFETTLGGIYFIFPCLMEKKLRPWEVTGPRSYSELMVKPFQTWQSDFTTASLTTT